MTVLVNFRPRTPGHSENRTPIICSPGPKAVPKPSRPVIVLFLDLSGKLTTHIVKCGTQFQPWMAFNSLSSFLGCMCRPRRLFTIWISTILMRASSENWLKRSTISSARCQRADLITGSAVASFLRHKIADADTPAGWICEARE